MADVQWIKLKVGMFDGDSFKRIKRAKIGGEKYRDKLTAVWFELLELAGRCNQGGRFISARGIPYSTIEDIATQIDRETDELDLCMKFFINDGMIEIVNGIYELANWEEHQNIEGLEKIREQNRLRQQKRRSKAKQDLLGEANVCAYCGKQGTTADHLIPRSKGGFDAPENIVCACLSCNMQKNNRDLDVFLNEMMATSTDFELDRILSNDKIMNLVTYDDSQNRFLSRLSRKMSRDITEEVTLGHATEIEKEKELEKDIRSYALSRARENDVVDNSMDDVDSEYTREQMREYMGGDLGEGLILMNDDQWAYICEHYSLDEIHYYFEVIKSQIRKGHKYTVKTHFQAFIDMAEKDRKKK